MKIKKIIKTLKFIKGYCKLRDCDCCVFSDVYGECCFSDGNCNLPNYWDIKNIENNYIIFYGYTSFENEVMVGRYFKCSLKNYKCEMQEDM